MTVAGAFRTRFAAVCAAGVLLTATGARAQGGGGGGGQPPPVRATSTVEVIDVGRGVDDIISRVRAQERTQAAPVRSTTGGKAAAGAPKGGKAEEARRRDGDDLRAERPERPRLPHDRDKRDGHHLDRENARRSSQVERARESRKP